jgi:hypothetical protein
MIKVKIRQINKIKKVFNETFSKTEGFKNQTPSYINLRKNIKIELR